LRYGKREGKKDRIEGVGTTRYREAPLRDSAVILVFAALMFSGVQTAAGTAAFAADPARGTFRPLGASVASVGSGWTRFSERGSRELLGVPVDPERRERELSRLAGLLRPAVAGDPGGADVPEAFRRILIREERFTYDREAGSPENYLIDFVLSRKRGNCLGLSLLWLSLAERLDLPFRGVYLPGHCFVRFEGNEGRVNVEFSDGGAPWEDDRYRREFRLTPERPYLRSLSSGEMMGVFLKSLGAAYAKRGKDEEALRIYADAERLSPALPDAPYNAGVSLQKLGRREEAAAKYREALSIDPAMAPARDNLGILLAREGRYAEAIAEARRAVELEPWNAAALANLGATYCACGRYEEGIREFRRAASLDPRNASIRAALVRALYARGEYREAATECDAAMALGCRFEPSMLEVLDRHREPSATGFAKP
jgi:tetratricopeptide (TPR) repeat protein